MKVDEDKYWKMVSEIGWGKRTNLKEIGSELQSKYSKEQIESLCLFVKLKRAQLVNKLQHHAFKKTGDMYGYYDVSDDGFWDLTAHIVGLGKEKYLEVCYDNPDIAKILADSSSYVENFEYIFHHIYE